MKKTVHGFEYDVTQNATPSKSKERSLPNSKSKSDLDLVKENIKKRFSDVTSSGNKMNEIEDGMKKFVNKFGKVKKDEKKQVEMIKLTKQVLPSYQSQKDDLYFKTKPSRKSELRITKQVKELETTLEDDFDKKKIEIIKNLKNELIRCSDEAMNELENKKAQIHKDLGETSLKEIPSYSITSLKFDSFLFKVKSNNNSYQKFCKLMNFIRQEEEMLVEMMDIGKVKAFLVQVRLIDNYLRKIVEIHSKLIEEENKEYIRKVNTKNIFQYEKREILDELHQIFGQILLNLKSMEKNKELNH